MRVLADLVPRVVPTLLVSFVLGASALAQLGHELNLEVPRDDQKGPNLNFERAQLEAFALSGDGSRLYTLNSHAARLVVFDVASEAKVLEVPIGLAPVAVARRPGSEELWVVDELASSIFVVDPASAGIVRTIRVGGLPHDLVFTPGGDRAYVTCSGVDRVDVVASATYQVVKSIQVPARDPRGITWADGHAWLVPLRSGNNTATYGEPGNPDRVVGVRVVQGGGITPLPDRDLLAIKTNANPLNDQLVLSKTRTGLGTTLFDVTPRPGTSELWIPNTDALNADVVGRLNFIGGKVVRSRIAVVSTQGGPPAFVDLDALAPPGEECSQPTHVAFDASGSRAFVSGYGTDRIAVLDLAGSSVSWAGSIELEPKQSYPGGVGPRQTLVSPSGDTLWVYARVDNALLSIDLAALPPAPFQVTASPGQTLGHDPVSDEERHGRNLFRDARLSKSQTSSCNSCHVDGHTDGLAWELSKYLDPEGTPAGQLSYPSDVKGPMVTQSTRRLQETGPFHWRGEKGGLLEFGDTFPELLELQVNGQPGLLGQEFQYIRHYMNRLTYPPNPRQSLDRELSPLEAKGAMVFTRKRVLGELTCASCHQLPLGTSGEVVAHVADGIPASGVVPALRGLADKLTPEFQIGGLFGERSELGAGLTHGGAFATIDGVLRRSVRGQPGVPQFNLSSSDIRALEAFLVGFDWGVAPAAGFAVTAHAGNAASVGQNELLFLEDQAAQGNCELIYYRTPALVPGQGLLFMTGKYDVATGEYLQNSELPPSLSRTFLLSEAAQGRPVTFLGVPLGMGTPMALDRDMDELWDYDEGREGADPENWDTDGDGLPDGYEYDLGMDPTVFDGVSLDGTPPALAAPARLVWATTNTLKFEFDVTEPVKVLLSYNGGPFLQRLPLGPPEFDRHHDVVLEELPAGTDITVELHMTDPSGNVFIDTSTVFTTRAPALAEPAFVDKILVGITSGAPNVLTADVHLRTDEAPVGAGYQVEGSVYHVLVGGVAMIAPSVQATTSGSGVAKFAVNLPAPSGTGAVVFFLQDVTSPQGSAPWILALDKVAQSAIHY